MFRSFGCGRGPVFVAEQFFELVEDYKQRFPAFEVSARIINQAVATGAKIGGAALESSGEICKGSAAGLGDDSAPLKSRLKETAAEEPESALPGPKTISRNPRVPGRRQSGYEPNDQ